MSSWDEKAEQIFDRSGIVRTDELQFLLSQIYVSWRKLYDSKKRCSVFGGNIRFQIPESQIGVCGKMSDKRVNIS